MNRIWGETSITTRLAFGAAIGLMLVVGFLGMLVVVPVVSPMAGADIADWLRGLVGPTPVAAVESQSFQILDAFNRFLSQQDGGKIGITLAQPASGEQTASIPKPAGGSLAVKPQTQGPAPAVRSQTVVKPAAPPPAVTDAVTAAPQIGWIPYGPPLNGLPVMAQALLTLDPSRPYAGIALVRMDLSQLQLHMMPGSQEPSHAPNVIRAIPNMGLTPAADQAVLMAAFNGGFRAVNGNYGMMFNGVTLIPATPGLETLAIYQDGHVAIGAWGTQITQTPDLVSFRQNCPPIIQDGSINPEVYIDNRVIWGNTVGNREITWRTAVGLSRDGRYLLYAVGNGTSVQTLAQALLQAGAYNAMQLDINHPFAHFVTYDATGLATPALRAVPLLNQMVNEPSIYLVTHQRDYFYLTPK
ncbi:MAG TPA: phosphodiester glycosidase family protein [Anaerolineales bacterium]